jgi:DUF4097 and DUF4098 domain-containing protein YvlB
MIKLFVFFIIQGPLFADTDVWNYKTSDVSVIEADVESGDISAVVSTDTLEVKLDDYYDQQNCEVSVKKIKDRLVLRIKNRSKWFNFSDKKVCKAGFKIISPYDKKLVFRVGAGDIDIGSFSNDISLRLGAGDVHLNATAGNITVSNGSGNINGDTAAENIKIVSGSGSASLNWLIIPQKGGVSISGGSFNADMSFPDKSAMGISCSGIGNLKSEFVSNSSSLFKINFKAGAGNLDIRKSKK